MQFYISHRNEMNELDIKVQEAKMANGIESTSRWFQTN